MLSNRQQVARLRHLAVQALGAYPLVAPELRFVAHGENTTFRVDAMAVGGRDRFLLRVHRPARHGQRLDSAAAVGSELDWLTALRADTGLSVPEPFRTVSGELTTAAASPDVPLNGAGRPGTGPRSAAPAIPDVLVLTPSIAFSLAGIASIKTPGAKYSGISYLRAT